jgi:arylsulfatase A-like enzyme
VPCDRRHGFAYWKAGQTHHYKNSIYFGGGCDGGGLERLTWDGYDAIAQTRDAQRFLETRAHADRPFLLWLSWGPPHPPYAKVPDRYRKLYNASQVRVRGNVPAASDAKARGDLANYYAHCTALDACVGDMLSTLDRLDVANNTIVVFTSDHGDMLYSHGLQRKQLPYEEATRIPLLLRVPGLTARRLDGTINVEDLMPTLLGLCGLPTPASVEGLDFSRYMRGAAPDPSGGVALLQVMVPRGQFSDALAGGKPYRGLRTARFTYVRDANGPWLLYDNEHDPLQMSNLVNRSFDGVAELLDEQLSAILNASADEIGPRSYYRKLFACVDAGDGDVRACRLHVLSPPVDEQTLPSVLVLVLACSAMLIAIIARLFYFVKDDV